ncbi:MAG: HlyD family type I secretion periplasmic adaptor subunit [Micavibrio sp.]
MTKNDAKEPQLRYLSQAIQLEEAVSPAILRTTMVVICTAILAFIGWAAFTNINEVARAPGEVVPDGYQRVVQHLEGGIIKTIGVEEGDIVEKGQLLLVLDGSGTSEDLQRARSKQISLLLQEERLRAFIEKREPDFSQYAEKHQDIIRDQQNFFLTMGKTSNEEKKIIEEQIEQKKRMINILQGDLRTARNNLGITQKLFDNRKSLYQKGFLSETRYLESQQTMNSLKGEIDGLNNRIAATQAEIREYRNRLSSLEFGKENQINERLDAIMAERLQHEDILNKLEQRAARLDIRAPVSGIVKGLSVNTIGAVAKPGETLMEIVPIESEMVVQVKIPPQHIGHLKEGQPVKVKFSSYDFSRYGLLDGKLNHISATTFNAQNGERYYQGRIKLDREYVGSNPSNIILPGMTVMAEIITGEKTILQYLLKPIHNSFKTAFSER